MLTYKLSRIRDGSDDASPPPKHCGEQRSVFPSEPFPTSASDGMADEQFPCLPPGPLPPCHGTHKESLHSV